MDTVQENKGEKADEQIQLIVREIERSLQLQGTQEQVIWKQ